MDISNIKAEIEKQTGIPASLLNGETVEENIAQAKAILAYKQKSGTEAEQFASCRTAANSTDI